MNNTQDSSTSDYTTPQTTGTHSTEPELKAPETETHSTEPELKAPETEVNEKEYGINKPRRIYIRATITHDKNKKR